MKRPGNSALAVGLAALMIIAMTAASVAAFGRAEAIQTGKQSALPKKNAPAQKPAADSTGWWITFNDTREMVSQDGTPCKVTLVMDLHQISKNPDGYGIYRGKSAVTSVGSKQSITAALHILTEEAVFDVTRKIVESKDNMPTIPLASLTAPGYISCDASGQITYYLASLITTVGGTQKPDKSFPFTLFYTLRTPESGEKTAGPKAIFFGLTMGPDQKVVFEGRYGQGAAK